jgi:hypothetical protein
MMRGATDCLPEADSMFDDQALAGGDKPRHYIIDQAD